MTLSPKSGRPSATHVDLPWKPNDPCPCGGADLKYADCCMQPDGLPLIRVPVLTTKTPTGYTQERCYLKFTRDCSDKLSREHYVSRNVLLQFGTPLRVTGFPWQGAGMAGILPPDSLTARVLCERHNNLLSPLDEFAGRTISALGQAASHATTQPLSKRTGYFLGSGDALERSAIKVLLGVYHARIATAEGQPVSKSHSLDVEALATAMMGDGLTPPLGVYMVRRDGVVMKNDVGFAALTAPDRAEVAGLHMQTRGLNADFIMVPCGVHPSAFSVDGKIYRPYVCDYVGPHRTGRAILTWAGKSLGYRRVGMRLRAERVS